ncbi:ABC transporter ATP-binding protein [Salinactinospora qingdaonensis]|uniref:ABC transporter ATP-binding protein n=1 Tax=Salinactinospora qingdaonensis TaxID=702744 RepID=A0ABP7EXW3_9ACTN
MGTAAVEVENVVKRYGRAPATAAVDGLSFRAAHGAVTALLGPNGAGKTTTVEMCEGFRCADNGRLRVLGLDPVADAGALKPRVGVMPQSQSAGVPTGARAGEWLRLMAAFHHDPIPPQLLLERLGLRSVATTAFRRLSGGQQQRLSLAAAVIGRPELVFLDEPTAGLDPQARRAAWDLVAELRDAGVGVVLTTHHMDEAERLADHVVIIDRGRVVAAGTIDELTAPHQELRFRATPGLDTAGLMATLPDGCGVEEAPSGTYTVTAPAPATLVSTVSDWCADNGILPAELGVRRRTLEEVFLEMTGRELRDG